MPAQQFKRINLDRLYPSFRDRLFALVAHLNEQGHYFFATRGCATYEEQAAIYAQGRTAPGPIVTHAPPGYSDHNFGIGTDFTHDSDGNPDNGLQPDWNADNYKALVQAAPLFGLESGAGYKDLPHVNWPGFTTGVELAPLREIYERTDGTVDAKLAAVWAYLDTLPVPANPSAAA